MVFKGKKQDVESHTITVGTRPARVAPSRFARSPMNLGLRSGQHIYSLVPFGLGAGFMSVLTL